MPPREYDDPVPWNMQPVPELNSNQPAASVSSHKPPQKDDPRCT